MSGEEGLKLTVELAGGAELLFDKKKKHEVCLKGVKTGSYLLKDLLVYMRDNLLTERPELFMQGDTVRPGILVLVNNTDWELLGLLDYVLQPEDNVLFISTLHGG